MPPISIISLNDVYARLSPDKVRRAFDDDNDGAPDDVAMRRLIDDATSLVMGKIVNTYDVATLKKMVARVDGLMTRFASSIDEVVLLPSQFTGKLGAGPYFTPRRMTVWVAPAEGAYNVDDPIIFVGVDEDGDVLTSELYLTSADGGELLTLEDEYFASTTSVTIPAQLTEDGFFKIGMANDVPNELKRLALDAVQAYYGMRAAEVSNYDGGKMLQSVLQQLALFGVPNGRRLDEDRPPEPAANHGGEVALVLDDLGEPTIHFLYGIPGW